MPQFLSDDWFAALDKEVAQIGTIEVPAAIKDLKIDLEVSDAPTGTVEAHMAAGLFKKGFADGAPTKIKLGYELARKLFIERDQSAGMQAFMSGQIKVEGDMSKMMQMQAGGAPSESQKKLEEAVAKITD